MVIGASGKSCSFYHTAEKNPDRRQYVLHNHYGAYEIFVFLEGDAQFVVEGAVYPLKKYDTVILNPNEFHNIQHLSDDGVYERVVVQVKNSFFTDNGCDRFRRMFDARSPGMCNVIPAEFTVLKKLPDIIGRMDEYAGGEHADILIPCVICELLSVLGDYHHTTGPETDNSKITPIVMYINENLTTLVGLDEIAERFYLNKYHLCRIFKKHTGMTINKYITHKRIVMVKNLCSNGKTLSQACQEAGFSTYSNFYKMYCKETGRSPRADMKKSNGFSGKKE